MRREQKHNTHDEPVRAADGRPATLGSRADADNADGAASDTNEAVDVAGADAEEAEDGGGRGRGGLSVNGRVRIWG